MLALPPPRSPMLEFSWLDGGVAQLGERRVRNAKVRSSILLISTKSSSRPCHTRPFSFRRTSASKWSNQVVQIERSMPAEIQHLQKRRHGIWYYRWAVPASVLARHSGLPKELKRSTLSVSRWRGHHSNQAGATIPPCPACHRGRRAHDGPRAVHGLPRAHQGRKAARFGVLNRRCLPTCASASSAIEAPMACASSGRCGSICFARPDDGRTLAPSDPRKVEHGHAVFYFSVAIRLYRPLVSW